MARRVGNVVCPALSSNAVGRTSDDLPTQDPHGCCVCELHGMYRSCSTFFSAFGDSRCRSSFLRGSFESVSFP
jgi:hypothetical protein